MRLRNLFLEKNISQIKAISELIFPLISRTNSNYSGGSYSKSTFSLQIFRIEKESIKQIGHTTEIGVFKNVDVTFTDHDVEITGINSDGSRKNFVPILDLKKRYIKIIKNSKNENSNDVDDWDPLDDLGSSLTGSKIADVEIDWSKKSLLDVKFFV